MTSQWQQDRAVTAMRAVRGRLSAVLMFVEHWAVGAVQPTACR
jgi:hypothetical protein